MKGVYERVQEFGHFNGVPSIPIINHPMFGSSCSATLEKECFELCRGWGGGRPKLTFTYFFTHTVNVSESGTMKPLVDLRRLRQGGLLLSQ